MNDDTSIYVVNDSGEACMRVSENVTSNDPTSIYGVNEDGKAAVRILGAGGGGGGGGGAVESVNGKTGAVILTAEDVDAQAETTIVNVSETSVVQPLANNTIYNCGEMTSLEVTLPATSDVGFIAQLNFTSGATPTAFTAPNTIKWLGNDVSTAFVPVANKRYAVLFFYDGVRVRGLVQGV